MKHKTRMQQIIQEAILLGGVEVYREYWSSAEEIVKLYPEEYELSLARGPDNNWKRLEYIGAD